VEICLDFIDNNNTPPLYLVEASLVVSAIISGMFQASPFCSPSSYKWRQLVQVKCVCKCAERNNATVRVKECRFERNTECKSEILGFVGLYWVELSVCIIPPIIYNLLPPWTYPVLGNHVNLLVCVLFVFAFGPVCTTIQTQRNQDEQRKATKKGRITTR
jgi:hypothetical protein